jgi:hypothetical protein
MAGVEVKRLLANPKNWLYVGGHLLLLIVGFFLCRSDSTTVSFAVGGSLIAAGLAGWIIFVYVLVSENVAESLRIVTEFGLINAFDARSVRIRQEYVRRLQAAHDQIDIVGFGLSAFREDFSHEFAAWKARADVRILLLDPEFPRPGVTYAAQRDLEEGNPPGKIETDVKKFVTDVLTLIGQGAKGSLEIRLYRCLPTLNVFRIDDDLFWGPYLVEEQSRNTPTFLVRRGGILFERFAAQFDRIWKSNDLSREVPQEWLRDA